MQKTEYESGRLKQLILRGVFQCHLVFGGTAFEGVSSFGVVSFPKAGTSALKLSAKPLGPKLLSSITKCQLLRGPVMSTIQTPLNSNRL